MSLSYFEADSVVAVLTTQPLGRALDYRAPEGGCWRGAFVEVPLGSRKVFGVVWGAGEGQIESTKLRHITRVLQVPPMRDELREFLTRAAQYTLTPLPAMLKLATRTPGLSEEPAMQHVYRLASNIPSRMTDARRRVIAVLEEYGDLCFTLGELAELAGVSPSVVSGLAKLGAVVRERTPKDKPFARLDHTLPGRHLNDEQAHAANLIKQKISADTYGTTLLQGITGSGKTEVYLEGIAACLAAGKQALVLLPEIALTAAFLARVESRFGALPAEWHSGIPLTQRRRAWRGVADGSAQMVIGARSALFLPFQNLGLIVVDEEHDTSYKQEEGVIYNARDMAVLRASMVSAQVILATATPSLESWANAEAEKYQHLRLRSRYGGAVLPKMDAVDMRSEDMERNTWISPTLRQAVRARLTKGEQSLLFLNRRGYASTTLCRACGHQVGCKHCDARLVEHRVLNRLMCHQCGETAPIPHACPSCQADDRLAAIGPGIERLTEEAQSCFPEARIALISSDMFGSTRALKARIREIADGEADIIVGTQLVAKGHNFPNLTLVGVIDADLGLHGGDLRASERTFQLIRQVAGRAGRGEMQGQALIQTFQPEHPVIRATLLGDEDAFWRAEAAERQAAGVPPFGRMAGIILSSPSEKEVFAFAQKLARSDGPLRSVGAMVFGPAPAPISRIRGRYRVRLLVKADKSAPLQASLNQWANQFRLPKGVQLSIDIDPQSFF